MLEDIRELLKDTFLKDAMMVELEIPRTTDIEIAIDVKSENAIEAWKLLKSHIPQTQRYPVLTSSWTEYTGTWEQRMIDQNFFNRSLFDEEYPEKLSPEQIIAKANSYTQNDLDNFLQSRANEFTYDRVEDEFYYLLEKTKAKFGIAPLEPKVRPEGINPITRGRYLLDWELLESEVKTLEIKTIVDVERYLLEWELKHSLQAEPDVGYPDWLTADKEVLILLPNSYSWNSLAYLDWWGGSKNSMYLLKQWDQTYGAKLIYCDGTALEFFVENKPSSIQEAFELAWQQKALAPDTFSEDEISIRDLARSLLELDYWVVYTRTD